MTSTPALKLSELPPGSMKSVTQGGKGILVANIGGTVHAIAQKCPHLGADLCQGRLSGQTVTCPKHGASIDVTDGHIVDPTKILFLKIKPKAAKCFAVTVEGDQISIQTP